MALMACLAGGGPVRAHALGAQCTLKGEKVEVEAYYSDNTPGRDAKVLVLDAAKKEVASGRTDDEGRWSFPAPPPGSYLVDVNAGEGHRVKVAITVPANKQPDTVLPLSTTQKTPACERPGAQAEVVAPVRISEGPSREEFTRVPWLKIALGLGFLGTIGFALWIRRRWHSARAERTDRG
jgi:hypothetical protein